MNSEKSKADRIKQEIKDRANQDSSDLKDKFEEEITKVSKSNNSVIIDMEKKRLENIESKAKLLETTSEEKRNEQRKKFESIARRPATYKKGGEYFETKGFRDWFNKTISGKPELSQDEKIEKLTEAILAKNPIKSIKETENIFIYEKGVYKSLLKLELQSQIKKLCASFEIRFTRNLSGDVINSIKAENPMNISDFDSDNNLVNLKNGILNLTTLELTDHSPKHLSRIQLSLEYNPSLHSIKISNLIREIVSKEDLIAFYQYFGACLKKGNRWLQIALMIHGRSKSGKTTLLNILSEFFGEDNVSNVDLSQFEDRREVAQLENKFVNMVSDIEFTSKLGITQFERWVGGDTKMLVHKKYIAHYNIRPEAKLVYTCSTDLPNVSRYTGMGFFRKWLFVECSTVHSNKDILKGKFTDEELSGLLNLAILGLHQLEKNECEFDEEKYNWEKNKDLWLTRSSDFVKFILGSENLKLKPHGKRGMYENATINPNCLYFVYRNVARDAFNYWRKKRNEKPITMTTLTKMMQAIPFFGTSRRMVSKKSMSVYTGFNIELSFITEYNEYLEVLKKARQQSLQP